VYAELRSSPKIFIKKSNLPKSTNRAGKNSMKNLPQHFDLHWDVKTLRDLRLLIAARADTGHLMESMVDEIDRLHRINGSLQESLDSKVAVIQAQQELLRPRVFYPGATPQEVKEFNSGDVIHTQKELDKAVNYLVNYGARIDKSGKEFNSGGMEPSSPPNEPLVNADFAALEERVLAQGHFDTDLPPGIGRITLENPYGWPVCDKCSGTHNPENDYDCKKG
jgi:hypothetical protein